MENIIIYPIFNWSKNKTQDFLRTKDTCLMIFNKKGYLTQTQCLREKKF